jgi:phage I-like protein
MQIKSATGHQISLHSAGGDGQVALCAPLGFEPDGNAAPDWIHLLPAGQIETADSRGPYTITDPKDLIAISMRAGRLPIDENHATDLAAPRGEPAPARGWIVELQNRADGIWGRVEWTKAGAELVAGRAYRAISPVMIHDKAKRVLAIARASLVNMPNLKGLTALNNQETNMNETLAEIAKALKLVEGTAPDAIVAAVTALHQKAGGETIALQAALGPIAQAAGLDKGAEPAAILGAVEGLKASVHTDDTVKALQAEITTMATELKSISEKTTRASAEAFVDGAIRAGRVGVKPLRDHYITRHMAEPSTVEKELNGLPTLTGQMVQAAPPKTKEGEISLNAEQISVANALGIDLKEYAKTLKFEQENRTVAL